MFILNTGNTCVGNCCLLISDAVHCSRYAPIFQRDVPSPSSALLYSIFLLLFLLVVFQARNVTSIILNFTLFFLTFLIFYIWDAEGRSNLTVEAAVWSETLVHNLTTTGCHIPHEVISTAISIWTSNFVRAEHGEARANRRTLFTFLYRSKSLSKCTCIFTGNHNTWKLVCQQAKSEEAISCLIQTAVKRQLGHTSKLLTDWLTNLFTYLLTHSMEQSPPWEANLFSPSKEIPRILWNPKVH